MNRLRKEANEERRSIIQNFVEKTTDLELPYLRGFGLQALAKVMCDIGGDLGPSEVFSELSKCEQVRLDDLLLLDPPQ